MELRRYFDILWRRKWIVLLTLVVTMAAVVIGTNQITPIYQASTTLRIAASAGGNLNYSEYVYAAQLMNTYVEIVTSGPVLNELGTKLSLKELPVITAVVIPNTELVMITVESSNPKTAAKAANTLAEILISESKDLYTGGGKTSQEVLGEELIKAQVALDQTRDAYARLIIQTPAATGEIETTKQLLQLNQSNYTTLLGQFTQASLREEIRSSMITVIEPAVAPQTPSTPRVSLNYAMGFVVGLVGGLGLALIFESQDTALYRSEDIEAVTELNAIARIPKANRKQLGNRSNDFSSFSDAFENLALNLQPAKDQPPKKVLLVMSAEPNQGKSMIAHRLALALAELGNKVVAIDCDVRLPKLHSLFELPNDRGLTNLLDGDAKLQDVLQASSVEGVKLLASGPPSAHPPKLLGSPQMVNLIDGLKRDFDFVILDTPAMLAVADITAVIPNVDSVLLVARRCHTRRESLRSVKKVLTGFRFRDKSVDLIVNQAETGGGYAAYRYHKKMDSASTPAEIKPA